MPLGFECKSRAHGFERRRVLRRRGGNSATQPNFCVDSTNSVRSFSLFLFWKLACVDTNGRRRRETIIKPGPDRTGDYLAVALRAHGESQCTERCPNRRAAVLKIMANGRATIAEIAELVGISRQAVRMWSQRAKIDAVANHENYLIDRGRQRWVSQHSRERRSSKRTSSFS